MSTHGISVMRRSVVRSAVAGLMVIIAASCAKPRQDIASTVRARAVKAGFDGAILIGERDGSSTIITTGANPVASDAVWRWASITKQLTAVIAMQEVAAGTLDVDAPIARYWPEWRSANSKSARVRDLMLHNSGLPQPDASTPDIDGVPAFYRASAMAPHDRAC
jgi:D-alanyl-D-alanine carboxypeptidase